MKQKIMRKSNYMNNKAARTNDYKWLSLLVAIYITILLFAPIAANKIVSIDGFATTSAAIFFPLALVLEDIITEVYGYQISRQLIWIFMITQFLFGLMIIIVIHLPAAKFAAEKDFYFNHALSSALRVAIIGPIVVAASSFLNIYILSKWKILFKGTWFSIRCVSSTMVGGVACSLLSSILLYMGSVPTDKLSAIFLTNMGAKLVYALVFTIPAVLCVRFLKKSEEIDRYDDTTNFNPFQMSVDYSDDINI